MEMKTLGRIVALILSSACGYASAAPPAKNAAPGADLPQMYSATAFGQAGAAAGKSFGLNLYVNGLTSDGQVEEYAATLKKQGPDALVRAMEKTKELGRLSPTGFVGTAFPIARSRPTPSGGLHIVMVTNRPMSFYELYNGTRSRDYKFGVVVLNVDKDGKGTGSLAPACKIKFNKKGELEIEHYGQKPLRLANVRRS